MADELLTLKEIKVKAEIYWLREYGAKFYRHIGRKDLPKFGMEIAEAQLAKVQKTRLDRPELGKEIAEGIQFFNLRFAELQSEKWLELGKPPWMDTTEIHRQAMDEAIGHILALFPAHWQAYLKKLKLGL